MLLTDGRDEDPNGMGLDALIGQLKGLGDQQRPIEVIAIGIGDDVAEGS